MLAKRIIPTILHKNGQLVKGQRFVNDRVIGRALQAARIHAMRGVDELMILDVGWGEPSYKIVKSLSEHNFSPITVGGGIKTVEHVKELLRSGADKVCLPALKTRAELIKEISEKFGKSTLCVSIDISGDKSSIMDLVYSMEKLGSGEILLQSLEREGTLAGYDLNLIGNVCKNTPLPVIASSGCSGYKDMYHAIQAGADAVAAGALFQFTDSTPKEAAQYLHSKGVEVRLD